VAATSRRRFLSNAAGIAAGGTVMALSISPAPAAAVLDGAALSGPSGPLDGSRVSPELRAAFQHLDAAHDSLKAADEACRSASDLYSAWLKRNRPPNARRAFRKWEARACKYQDEIGSEAACDALEQARKAFRAAQRAVAKIRVSDMNELATKASIALVYENRAERHLRYEHAIIAQMVALDIVALIARGVEALGNLAVTS
jgi:hypothetical protein